MSERHKVEITCFLVDGRFVPTSPIWDEHDPQFCIHGEKLRWTCDECAELIEQYFPANPGGNNPNPK